MLVKYAFIFFACSSILISCKMDSSKKANPVDTSENKIVEKPQSSEAPLEIKDTVLTSVDSNNEDNHIQPVEDAITTKTPPKKKIKETKAAPKKKIAKKNKKRTVSKKAVKKKKTAKKAFAKANFKNKVFQFDTIMEGDIVEHDFDFYNVGTKPLQILEADASCGCTTPVIPFLDINPGKKNRIQVTFNSINKPGKQEATVQIKTNGVPQMHTLKMIGYVKPKKKDK